ncbi:MAG: DUF255 domain-containing protein [bacterium]|jgi:uncharacterized protein YyaL (SSP411 family)
MSDSFRFSPRPNRAHEIAWRPWGREAFEEAARRDRPVLLNLTAVWCHWCHVMDETTYSDPEIIDLVNRELVPVRVDADRYPHVQDRYIAGGWPTNAFLTPTGEVLWAGTYVPPDQFRAVAGGVLAAWRGRRAELQAEIERRRKALEAARSRHRPLGLVRREAADDVLTAIQEAFDPRNGGFGSAPKFPNADAVELLFVHAARGGGDPWRYMAQHTLDGMLAGELEDRIEGGFFRYATASDWTKPHYEKMLEGNAALLGVYALGAHLMGRRDWRAAAERIVAWAEATLRRPDGLWGGSQDADEEYYHLDADGRRGRAAPYVDPFSYTNWTARWIRALASAGGHLGREDWIARAAQALETLLTKAAAEDGLFYHVLPADDGDPEVHGLLADALEAAAACIAVAQATGRGEFLDRARDIVSAMQRSLWVEDGGFMDHVATGDEPGALRYRDRPFEPNALAARVLLDLAHVTGERSYRALAERILALLSPLAGRYGVSGAVFALAVEEFFEPPLRVVVVGPVAETAELRAAALALPQPDRRVWTLEKGGRIGPLTFPATDEPAAYVCGARSCSPPIHDGARLADAVQSIR